MVLKLHKPQLSLSMKHAMTLDLQNGMKETEAVTKYNTSKGTACRVRSGIEKYLDVDEIRYSDRKRMKPGTFEDMESSFQELPLYSVYSPIDGSQNCKSAGND